ncbi:MAG: hypothetical protein K0S11_1020 [Gammaproteobacteria bacterium]|jgi:hypothetical protein|nr:hypothetical protein [Gammaproteobacteria bacterium]
MFGFFTPLRACLKAQLEDYPLHGPASSGNAKLLNYLIENHKKSIDVNEYQGDLTALHLANAHNHYLSMSILLDHDAFPSPKYKQVRYWTPLHSSIHRDDYTAIRLLLAYGASLTVKDKHGHTPVFYVNNHIEFNDKGTYRFKPVNKPVLQRMIQETLAIKKHLDTYNHQLKQALERQDHPYAARCYKGIAEQWQLLGELEGHNDMRNFYFHKALGFYQKAIHYNPNLAVHEQVAHLQQWLLLIDHQARKTHYPMPQAQSMSVPEADNTERSRLLPSSSYS